MKILLTSTSFQDTPGEHHHLLEQTGFKIDTLRGPVKEDVLLPIIADYDAVICGDDEYTKKVLEIGKNGKLRLISKYGVGLDKIDLDAAKELEILVFNTPGVNQITVAEHALTLMLTALKNVHTEHNITQKGEWKRLIGNELYEKKVGILGLGKIGKELAKRLSVFGVELFAFDLFFDEDFISEYNITKCSSAQELGQVVDILSINMPLTPETKGIINNNIFNNRDTALVIVNTSRALIVDQDDLYKALGNGKVKFYATDVMDQEPMIKDHKLLDYENVLITPHIGSRTHESVTRQGIAAINNLIKNI